MTSKSFSIKNKSSFENCALSIYRQVHRWLNLQFSNFDPLTPKQTRIACSNIPDLLISEVKKFFYQKKKACSRDLRNKTLAVGSQVTEFSLPGVSGLYLEHSSHSEPIYLGILQILHHPAALHDAK